MALFLLIIAVVIVVGVVQSKARRRAISMSTASLGELPNFQSTVVYHSPARGYGLAIDAYSNQFAMISPESRAKAFPFSDLVAAELIRNETNVIRASGVGVSDGPLSVGGGKGRIDVQLKSVSLKLYTRDIQRPVYTVCFGRNLELADDWYGRFRSILSTRPIDARSHFAGNLDVAPVTVPSTAKIAFSDFVTGLKGGSTN
jgi:hypothetical protein